MAKKLFLIIGILVALAAVGAGSFYGGTVYAAQQTTNVRTAFLNSRGGTGANGAGPGANAPGGAGFGGGVSGTIKSVNGNTLTVSTAQNVTTVTLSGSTNVLKSTTAAASDLQVGEQVTVRGQRDSAGNVTATTIQIVPAGTTLGGPGGGPNGAGPSATPTP